MPRLAANSASEQPRISEGEAQTVLEQIEQKAVAPPNAKTRRLRAPYKSRKIIIETEEGAGRTIRQVLQGRNISTFGLAAIHNQFVHSGRGCTIYLMPLEGNTPVAIPAKIKRCRFISGRVHEIAITFENPVDIRIFTRLAPAEARRYLAERKADNLESAEPAEAQPTRVAGTALVLESIPISRQLSVTWLTKLGLNVLEASDSATAEKLLAANSVHLIMVDVNQDEAAERLGFIRKLRSQKVETPILSMSAESSAELRKSALTVGCDEFLNKPFQRDELYQIILSLIMNDPFGPMQHSPIRSSSQSGGDNTTLVETFVDQIRTLADMLRSMVEINDFTGAMKICRRVAEGGKAYGIEPVFQLGVQALQSMQADQHNLIRIRREVDRLINGINRVQA